MEQSQLFCGIDRIRFESYVLDRSLRYGLVTNEGSIDRHGTPVKKVLIESGYHLVKLFSPEHGMDARGEDGLLQSNRLDVETGLEIISLYGGQLKPNATSIKNLDAILFDLPNVGVRFYTYLWTMSYVMEWCAEQCIPFIVLDRPNPLGGALDLVEGPVLEPAFYSFLGRWNIPIRFSLTIGELAIVLKNEMGMDSLTLQVVTVDGWSRNQTNKDFTYPFKAPSPALLSDHALWTYPALCFLEATNISEGRNGPHSFEVAYAPYLHGQSLESLFNSYLLPGIQAEAHKCTPSEGKYKGQSCEGIRLIVTDPGNFRPIHTGLILLAMIRTLYPNQFEWNAYPTHVNPTGQHHFELLIGTTTVKVWLEDQPLDHLDHLSFLLTAPDWKGRVESSLLYV